MKKDAKLTFDHFLLLAQLGRAPPEWMILLLLEESPDFIASDMSLVVSTVDEVLEYPIDDPPFYQPSILEKHFEAVKEKERLEKEKDSSDTSEAEREAASGSGAAEGSAQASASTSTDSGANADAATPGVNAFGISEGSWPPIPTMAHLEMLQDMDEDDDASHTTSDVESAMQIRLEAEEERQRAGRSTTELAARERAKDRLKEDDDPEELVALFAGNVRKFKEKEADRRALATWRWTRAFAALLKKVHNDYSVKRALAREDMETSGKSIRTRHSGFKKWLVKFIERYQTESNTFRLRVMEQKRALIDSTELTGENPVEALRDLPWLLEDIKKRHREQTASDYSSANYPWSGRGDSERLQVKNLHDACYRFKPNASTHPRHRYHSERDRSQRATAARAKRTISTKFNRATGAPHYSEAVGGMWGDEKDEDDEDYKPEDGWDGKPRKQRIRKKAPVLLYSKERAISPPCEECDYPDEKGKYTVYA